MTRIELGAETTVVSGEHGAIELALGYERTARECFRDDPPTAADIERAINTIEDELERARHLVTPGPAKIRTTRALAAQLAGDEVERRYQELVATPGITANRGQVAAVVILREMAHHLGIVPRYSH